MLLDVISVSCGGCVDYRSARRTSPKRWPLRSGNAYGRARRARQRRVRQGLGTVCETHGHALLDEDRAAFVQVDQLPGSGSMKTRCPL